MRTNRKKIGGRAFWRLAVVLTCALVVLSTLGCAGSATPSPTSKPAPAAAPTTAPAQPAAAAPTTAPAARDSQLAVAIDTEPAGLDLRLVTATQAYSMIMHFQEPLTFRDTTGKVVPWLAEGWEREGDLVWKFKLRKNVKFDNGEPLDAESVKYTIDSIKDPAGFALAQHRSRLDPIDRVDIVDSSTVAIKTKNPMRTLASELALVLMLPPKAARELGKNYASKPSGTGPYKVVEFVPGSRLVLEAKKDYWGGAPANDKLTMRFLPEPATRVAALEAGEVAMINNAPVDQIDRIKANAKLDVAEVLATRYMSLNMMTNRPPFNDVQVRRAINQGMDKEGIVKALLNGHGKAMTNLMLPPAVLYSKQQTPYEYDVNKAKKMIADAGAAGAKIKLGYMSGRFLNDRQVGQAVAQQLEKLGFSVQAETGEWAGLYQKMMEGYFDIFFWSWASWSLDPDFVLSPLFTSSRSNVKYNNPKVDQLLLKGNATSDPKEAEAIYQELQSLIWQDSPTAWLYYTPEIHGVSKKLRGYSPRPDEYMLFKDAYVEK